MVLEKYVSRVELAEALPFAELAVPDAFIELRAEAVIFEDLCPVEPVAYHIALHHYPGRIPAVLFVLYILLVRRNEVIQGSEGAVAVYAELRIRMEFVVKYLVLTSYSRAGRREKFRVDEILDSAVGPRREFEID